MEELQDAIEDAQYVNAIATQEEGPRPVLSWEIPSEDQLLQWQQQQMQLTSKAFSIDWVLERAIGFFLFSQYVKEVCHDYLRMNFVEEVARWKRMKGKHRVERARKIVQVYCRPLMLDPNSGQVIYPKRTEIDEYDLDRSSGPSSPSSTMSREEITRLYGINMVDALKGGQNGNVQRVRYSHSQYGDMDPHVDDFPNMNYVNQEEADITTHIATTINCLGIQGPALQEVLQALREIETTMQQRKSAPAADLSAYHNDKGNNGSNTSDHKRRSSETASSSSTKQQQQHLTNTNNGEHLRNAKSRYTSLRELTNTMKQRELSNLNNNLFDKLECIIVESLRKDYYARFQQNSMHYTKLLHFLWFQDRTVVPDDFFTMRVLGRGGFGLVTACKKGTSGKLYAMKVMNKKRIKLKKSEALTVNERKALAAVESPFVVNLKYSFHSKDDVYLILDLMTGGDLGYHLHQKGKFPKKECQYYGARIMLGLQALHDKGYVYRDLKPENCLLDEHGRVKITDLGLATKITPKLHGAAGTRGYWAPEMLRRDANGKRLPYGHTVDWFSYGCCMAEFISGGNPFRSEAALNFGLERGKETKEKAIDHATMEMEPDFPEVLFDPEAADFCRRLLEKNEKVRIGTNGCEEIMAHPWFKNMNWESVISDRKRPPFIPPKDVNAASQSEIGNFTEDKKIQECVIDARDESYYKDWDWTNPHAYAVEVIEFLIYERDTGEPLVPISQQSSCCCDIL